MGYQDTLKRCGEMLQSVESVQGGTQRICNPLLSVFAGDDAVRNAALVKGIYRKCWTSDADLLPVIEKECLDEGDIVNHVVDALRGRIYERHNAFYQAFYWDIMDDHFDENFQVLREAPRVPIAYNVYRLFFLFARKSKPNELQLAEKRLTTLMKWAKENNEHILILTDTSSAGYLDDEGWLENYQVAADITAICNSISTDNRIIRLGFYLLQGNIFSAGYHAQGKNIREIAAVTIVRLLENYQKLSSNDAALSNRNPENNLDYNKCFENIFNKMFADRLPTDTAIFRYLDYTDSMKAFYESFSKNEKRGLFGLFSKNKSISNERYDINSGIAAKQSVETFWKLLLKKYYSDPIDDVLNSVEEGKTGEEKLREELRAIFTNHFSYQQLGADIVKEEARRLKNISWEEIEKMLPQDFDVSTPEEWFAISALRDIKVEWYQRFFEISSEILFDLNKNAGAFAVKIEEALRYYRPISSDESIREAYSRIVDDVCANSEDLIRRVISPCEKTEELLAQLERLFSVITGGVNEFRYSFADELRWRMNMPGNNAIEEVVRAALAVDVENTGRVQLFNTAQGKLYTLMREEDVPPMMDNLDVLGEIYDVPQSDKLERIFVYPVDSSQIIW